MAQKKCHFVENFFQVLDSLYTTNNPNFQVKIWFQNRRAKERKQMKKRDELIHKEKLEVAATLQAAASAASNVHHPFTFPHPAVMSAHLP